MNWGGGVGVFDKEFQSAPVNCNAPVNVNPPPPPRGSMGHSWGLIGALACCFAR